MRTIESRLTVFTFADGSEITTRSALESRWAIFFNELRLKWKYEPCRLGTYLPDFEVEGLGFVEIKPTLALLISESSRKIQRAARQFPEHKFYVFIGGQVSLGLMAMYQGKSIFALIYNNLVHILYKLQFPSCDLKLYFANLELCKHRANRAKLDHSIPSTEQLLEAACETARQYMAGGFLGGDGERTNGGPVEAEPINRALSPGRHDPPLLTY